MTQQEVVKHWRRGARDALETAQWNCETGKYDLSLFHCHLAVEKALKAAYVEKFDEEHPHTHELLRLALLLKEDWDQETKELLSHLSGYAIAARYSDPGWAAQ